MPNVQWVIVDRMGRFVADAAHGGVATSNANMARRFPTEAAAAAFVLPVWRARFTVRQLRVCPTPYLGGTCGCGCGCDTVAAECT